MLGFVPHNALQLRKMLRAVGASSLRGLLPKLPNGEPIEHKVEGIPEPLSEWEIEQILEERLFQGPLPKTALLGAGAYCHAIPAAVEALAQRGEFLTSYTPYQPEASQGTLTALFEFQTFIARLFGMEIANSSMYDGASALSEAVLMAFRITKRHKALIKATLHPEYRETMKTYAAHLGYKLKTLPITPKGTSDLSSLEAELDQEDPVGAIVVDYPSFLGTLEDLGSLVELAHKKGALVVSVTYEPTALGLFKAPGDFGVDIAVGEGQALGNPVAYGGATLGLFATKASLVRQMPGRLVGETRDTHGQRAFCITLATREQHIRREKATSNICTNHAHFAIRTSIYLALLGASGIRRLAKQNFQRAHYLAERILEEIPDACLLFDGPFFNEFAAAIPGFTSERYQALSLEGILFGIPLRDELIKGLALPKESFLVCATETLTYKQLEEAIKKLARVIKDGGTKHAGNSPQG